MSEEEVYKRIQEEFVSGHDGTSVLEIAGVVSSAPLAVLLRKCLMTWMFPGQILPASLQLVIDFITVIVPVLVCFTLGADYWESVLSAMAFSSIAFLLVAEKTTSLSRKSIQFPSLSTLLNVDTKGKRPSISHFRAYVNVATAISILAVDFVIQPRRFCKAETFGSGLMDVGVGAFVISNAIVSPEARGKFPDTSSLQQKWTQVWQAAVSTLPLIVLGLVRLAAVKAADYQEHVSEYGVHWNFFFTLAFVRVLSTVLLCIVKARHSWLLSISIALGYQYLLSYCNLQDYIIHGPLGDGSRPDILSANREGLFSCLGYLSIYFAGVQLGRYLLQDRSKLRQWLQALVLLCILDAICWVLLHYCQDLVDPISRRIANLSFVIWMLAYNLHLLPSFLLVDLCLTALEGTGVITGVPKQDQSKAKEFCLLEAVNRNGLFYFLLANLLTGVINKSMYTLYVEPMEGLAIVTVYMLVLSIITAVLHVKNITLKFW